MANKGLLAATVVVSLIALSAFSLLERYTALPGVSVLASLAFLALCVGSLPSFGLREWVLAVIAISLSIGLLLRPDGGADASHALDRAAFFAAFIYLVTLLKEAAQRSPSVVELGTYLTRQPAGRRYHALAFGGHAMGVVLNFGAISLITPLIQRGVQKATPDPALRALLEQQQITALIRGFSWMIMWSPTAMTQAVLLTSIPGSDLSIVIVLGLSAALVMIFIGRVEDRWRWRGRLPRSSDAGQSVTAQALAPAFPQRAAWRFALVCSALILGAWVTTQLASVRPAIALMLVAPLIMSAWVFSQRLRVSRAGVLPGTVQDLWDIVQGSSNYLGKSAITLGAAGFIGEAAARLAPVDALAAHLQHMNLPDWAFLMCLPMIITLCGQVALSPILVVVFLSSVINQLPVLPANPSLIVFALGAGWALSMSASPNASASLLISSVTGIAPTTLTWRWNGRYALMCAVVFFLSFFALSRYFSS